MDGGLQIAAATRRGSRRVAATFDDGPVVGMLTLLMCPPQVSSNRVSTTRPLRTTRMWWVPGAGRIAVGRCEV